MMLLRLALLPPLLGGLAPGRFDMEGERGIGCCCCCCCSFLLKTEKDEEGVFFDFDLLLVLDALPAIGKKKKRAITRISSNM